MKIKLLDIRGFGKFHNRTIVPGEGFNLIFGNNESGKSTLAEFTEAMLYGAKGGKKVRGPAVSSERAYKPWKAGSFAGVMEYVLDDGSLFRIDRDFDKGTAHIRDGTARDITAQFALGRDTGPRFAEAHLNLARPVFEKSALIRQMQSAIDDAGREALLEKLANLNTAGSEDLSLTKALDALNSAMLEKVGTGRSTTRPLDRIQARLSELEKQKTRILEQNERYLDTFLLLKAERDRRRQLSKRLIELTGSRDAQIGERLLAIKAECLDLDGKSGRLLYEIKRLGLRLDNARRYEEMTELSLEALNKCLYEYREVGKRLADLNSKLENLKDKNVSLKEKLDNLKPLKEKVERIERATAGQGDTRDKAPDRNKSRGISAVPRLFPLVLIIISVAGFVFSILHSQGIGQILAIFSGVLLLAGILILSVLSGKRGVKSGGDAGTISALEACENETTETGNRMESLIAGRGELLRKIALFLSIPVIDGWNQDRIEDAVESFKAGYRGYREDSGSLNLLEQELKACGEKRDLLLREASAIAKKEIHSADDLDATDSGTVSGRNEYPDSTYGLEDKIRETNEDIKAAEIEIKALETKIENVPSLEALGEIDEESVLLEERKRRLEITGKSLTLAMDVLKNVAHDLQKNYTPGLNGEMSRLIGAITDGRYKGVRTDSNLRLLLEVPESEELMPINRLSGGTIDQIYFAMRLSAVALMERGKETIPLLLDEPFSQYDEERARHALLLLKETSISRQVFFFTCRQRELEMAQNIWGDDMNIIML